MIRSSPLRELLDINQNGKTKHLLINVIRKSAKAALDYSTAFIGLLILAPFFGLIAILIKRDSPGPVFFLCPRMGKDGKPFGMLKFRTMYEHPDSYQGPRVTCREDDRITPIGRWLRDTKINELPQLWNILRGEMSLVGPRPEDPDIARNWPEDAFNEILSVKPGITSPASILYHDEEYFLSAKNVMGRYFKYILPDKLRLDRLYVRNASFFSDLDIIFWTIAIIIPHLVKAYIPEGDLFSGPISRLVNRYLSWFFTDLITSLLVVGIAGVLWRTQMPLNWGIQSLSIMAMVLALLFSGVNSIIGLNHVDWERATPEDGFSLTLSGSVITLVFLILNYFHSIHPLISLPPLPAAMIFTIGLMAQIGFVITRYRWRLLTTVATRWLTWRGNAPGSGERALIVGAGDGCQMLTWLLRRKKTNYAFSVIGIVDDDIPTKDGMTVDGYRIIGRIADIPALVKKYNIGLIIFTTSNFPLEIREYALNLRRILGTRLIFLDKLMKLVEQQFAQVASHTGQETQTDDQMEYFALRDEVTGLPNRYLFQDRLKYSLAHVKRYHTELAVLYISLDGYSTLLGKSGCDYSESILKETADRLLHCKRESDTLAYLDDYEFALILDNVPDQNLVETIVSRITTAIEAPYQAQEKTINLNVKIRTFMGADVKAELADLQDIDLGIFVPRRSKVAHTDG